jgi:hypothetical protein
MEKGGQVHGVEYRVDKPNPGRLFLHLQHQHIKGGIVSDQDGVLGKPVKKRECFSIDGFPWSILSSIP